MSNKIYVFLATGIFILSACAPSAQAVQTAVAKTEAAYTPTPQPTATTNPCTDKGWADMATYLKQFDKALNNTNVDAGISSFLDGLASVNNEIKDVVVDTCTESAKQDIVNSRENIILAFTLASFRDADKTKMDTLIAESSVSLKAAKAKLKKLGIILDYP